MAQTVRGIDDSGAAATTDATVTTIVSRAAHADCVGSMTVRAEARQPSDGDAKTWLFAVSYRRSSGDVTILGQTVQFHETIGAALWDCVADADGGNVRIRVTGQASTAIEWHARISGDEMEAT